MEGLRELLSRSVLKQEDPTFTPQAAHDDIQCHDSIERFGRVGVSGDLTSRDGNRAASLGENARQSANSLDGNVSRLGDLRDIHVAVPICILLMTSDSTQILLDDDASEAKRDESFSPGSDGNPLICRRPC